MDIFKAKIFKIHIVKNVKKAADPTELKKKKEAKMTHIAETHGKGAYQSFITALCVMCILFYSLC